MGPYPFVPALRALLEHVFCGEGELKLLTPRNQGKSEKRDLGGIVAKRSDGFEGKSGGERAKH